MNIPYKSKFIDSYGFMASSLSNLVDNYINVKIVNLALSIQVLKILK